MRCPPAPRALSPRPPLPGLPLFRFRAFPSTSLVPTSFNCAPAWQQRQQDRKRTLSPRPPETQPRPDLQTRHETPRNRACSAVSRRRTSYTHQALRWVRGRHATGGTPLLACRPLPPSRPCSRDSPSQKGYRCLLHILANTIPTLNATTVRQHDKLIRSQTIHSRFLRQHHRNTLRSRPRRRTHHRNHPPVFHPCRNKTSSKET